MTITTTYRSNLRYPHSQTDVVEDVSQSSPSLYRSIDNQDDLERCEQMEQEEITRRQTRTMEETEERPAAVTQQRDEDRGEGDQHIEPYIPQGLACADDRFKFNFDFFLLDELELTHGLLPSDCTVLKTFTDVLHCNNYCMEYVRGFTVPEGHGAPEHLNKEEMFYECGMPLEDLLRTGEENFDKNLGKVRTDRYGNVMVLGAPKWSDLCPNFMHGFPRAMCPTSHGGFLKGNLTVAARITNQVVRTICPGDIASLCSETTLSGLGLTVSELFVARQVALKYSDKAQQPHRLVMTMIRYGIDFLTLSTLQPGTIRTFMGAAATVSSNNLMTLQPSESDTSDSSAAESSDDSVVSDPDVSIDMSQFRTQETQTGTIAECRMNMTYRFVSHGQALPVGDGHQETATQEQTEPVPSTPPSRSAPSSSGGRATNRKRRKTAGREACVVVCTPQAPSTSRSKPMEVPPNNLRQRLSEFPGIKMARVPKLKTLNVMKDFMMKNVPISTQEVDEETRRLVSTAADPEARTEPATVGQSIQVERRSTRVAELLHKLWEFERVNCVCPVPTNQVEGDAAGPDVDSQDIQCAYQLDDMNQRQIDPQERPCRATRCKVCVLFADNNYFSSHCTRITTDKNRRMQFLLYIAPSLADMMWSERVQTSAANTREIRSIWRELLCCSEEKLVGILNVGHLVQIVPRLNSLVLTSGWSKFWTELRKLGAALAYQDNDRTKLATLLYIRTEFVPDNAWKAVLTAGTEAEKEVWRVLQGEGDAAESDNEEDEGRDLA